MGLLLRLLEKVDAFLGQQLLVANYSYFSAFSCSCRKPCVFGEADMSSILLIVDDDVSSCHRLCEFLSDMELEIKLAHDCGQALDLFWCMRPQFALININMPDHDGIWLAQRILGIDYKSVIFLMSDNPLSLIRAGRHQLGVAAIMEKPLDFGRFKTMIKPRKDMGLLW